MPKLAHCAPPLPPICGEKKSPKNLQNLVIPILAELKYFIVYFLGPAQILHDFCWALQIFFYIFVLGTAQIFYHQAQCLLNGQYQPCFWVVMILFKMDEYLLSTINIFQQQYKGDARILVIAQGGLSTGVPKSTCRKESLRRLLGGSIKISISILGGSERTVKALFETI